MNLDPVAFNQQRLAALRARPVTPWRIGNFMQGALPATPQIAASVAPVQQSVVETQQPVAPTQQSTLPSVSETFDKLFGPDTSQARKEAIDFYTNNGGAVKVLGDALRDERHDFQGTSTLDFVRSLPDSIKSQALMSGGGDAWEPGMRAAKNLGYVPYNTLLPDSQEAGGVKPVDVGGGKLWVPGFQGKTFTGSKERQSNVSQGWIDPEWARSHVKPQVMNGVGGYVVSQEDFYDPKFGTKITGSFRGEKKDGGLLGGLGPLGQIALPIALAAMGVPAGLSTMLGGGTAGAMGAGALMGGGMAGLSGGDVLKGALSGGLSGGLGNYVSGAGFSPTTARALSGLGGQAISSVVRGQGIDPTALLIGAASGAAGGATQNNAVNSLLSGLTRGILTQQMMPQRGALPARIATGAQIPLYYPQRPVRR